MNHGDAAPLAAVGIVPASFLSRGACFISNFFVLGIYASASTVAFSFIFSSASPEVNYCPIWTGQVAKSIHSPSSSRPPPLQSLIPTLVSLPLFATASTFKILFQGGGGISISLTCPQPMPYFSFISWALRIPLGISSQLIRFFGSRPRHFHRHLWGLFTTMVPISCVKI